MKFLVVDDSSTMRKIITHTLTKTDQDDVVEAVNGREAIQALNAGDIDFIVTDWNMPEMDGIEFVREVRSHGSWRTLPILMVTTNSVGEEVVKAVKAGITDYIVKPFRPETLQSKIRSILANRSRPVEQTC